MQERNSQETEGKHGTQRVQRTPPKQMARQLARHLRSEHAGSEYLRAELEAEIPRAPKRLPYVPGEEQIRRYYRAVWGSRNFGDMVLIKTLLYAGVRVSELVNIHLAGVDLDRCQIQVAHGKGRKDRVAPFRLLSRKRFVCTWSV